jgi:hypothetical protein
LFGVHVPVDAERVPAKQERTKVPPVIELPAAHVGVHVVPDGIETGQDE